MDKVRRRFVESEVPSEAVDSDDPIIELCQEELLQYFDYENCAIVGHVLSSCSLVQLRDVRGERRDKKRREVSRLEILRYREKLYNLARLVASSTASFQYWAYLSNSSLVRRGRRDNAS